jgi:hypothetical protein
MRLLAILASCIVLAAAALAISPRELLVGSWYFKRGVGYPCDSLIVALEYHFRKDGGYSTRTRMKDGNEYKYDGTYVATDTSATAVVNGIKVGPYPYTIKDGILTINQPDSHCDVELTKE